MQTDDGKDFAITSENGTEIHEIEREEAEKLCKSAEVLQKSLSCAEQDDVEMWLIESDVTSPDFSDAEAIAAKIEGVWFYVPKAFRN